MKLLNDTILRNTLEFDDYLKGPSSPAMKVTNELKTTALNEYIKDPEI